MSTVPRIALTYFSMVPLQRWVGGVGAAMIVAAVSFGALGHGVGANVAAGVLSTLGAVLIGMTPAVMGGAAMRYASSRTMLHLRPHGRVHMLLGALLAITMLACLIVLPLLLIKLGQTRLVPAPAPPSIGAGEVFAIGWCSLVLVWIAMFALSCSPVLTFLALFLPVPVAKAAVFIAPFLPGPIGLLGIGLAAWLLFAWVYLSAGAFRPPRWYGDRSSQGFEGSPLGALVSRLEPSRGAVSRQRAIWLILLGTASPLRYAFSFSAWLLLLLFALHWLTPDQFTLDSLPNFLLSMAAMSGATAAYMLVRRARQLWLRHGPDRAGLFLMVERGGLELVLLLMGILAGAVLALVLFNRPGLAVPLLVYSIAQVLFSICLFYGGLSLTRGWTPDELGLSIALALLFVVQTIALRPTQGTSTALLLGALVFYLVLALLLRRHARRRWLTLDWRLARLPTYGRITGT
jgi:hypothetical protein